MCCFSKNVPFHANEAFGQGQEYHGPKLWKLYEEFDIDILKFVDTPMHLLHLGIKKYMINIIPSLLKPGLRQKQHFGRIASKFLDLCRENSLDWCNANKFTNKDGTISNQGWKSSHYQAFTRVSLPIYSHFDNILNDDQL